MQATVCDATYKQLPATSAIAFFANEISTDASFRRFHDEFRERGFEFIPERVKLFMGLPMGQTKLEPYLFAVCPSFKAFGKTDPSHEAIGIGYLRQGGKSRVVVGKVVVDHSTWNIASLTTSRMNAKGQVTESRFDDKTLKDAAPDEITRMISRECEDDKDGPVGPTGAQFAEMSKSILDELLHDPWANRLYPSNAILSLLDDMPLLNRWVMALESSPGRPNQEATACCCVACSCCNACSSCIACCCITINL